MIPPVLVFKESDPMILRSQRLKLVVNIDIEVCSRWGSSVRGNANED